MRPSDILTKHRQTHQTSCAASGMEVVLKCHGKLPLDDDSLQAKYGGANIGFGEMHELKDRGLVPTNRSEALPAALSIIQAETAAGRYPLVALPIALNPRTTSKPCEVFYHIFVAEDDRAGLAIVDPATAIAATGDLAWHERRIRGILAAVAAAGCHVPNELNFLTYVERGP